MINAEVGVIVLKPKAWADNTDTRFDIMQKQNSVIVLLYIFKQFAKEDTSLQVGKSLRTLQMRSLEISQTLNLT